MKEKAFFERERKKNEITFFVEPLSSESLSLAFSSLFLSSLLVFPPFFLPFFLPTDPNMFRGAFQTGYLTVFNAVGSKPLQLWETDGVFVVVFSVSAGFSIFRLGQGLDRMLLFF